MRSSEDEESQLQIRMFLDAVMRQKANNPTKLNKSKEGFTFPSAGGITTNRGNKLLQSSEGVSRAFLNNSAGTNREEVFYNGSVHKLLARKRRHEEDVSDDEQLDLHKLVDLRPVSYTHLDVYKRQLLYSMLR